MIWPLDWRTNKIHELFFCENQLKDVSAFSGNKVSQNLCINFKNQTCNSSGFLKETHNSLLNACSFLSQIFACVDSHPSFWIRQKINYGVVYLSNSIWINCIFPLFIQTNFTPNIKLWPTSSQMSTFNF